MSQAILEIHVVPCLSDNYAYIIASGGSAVVVDPSEAVPVQAALDQRGLALVGIWATHHHHDHVGGIAGLVEHHAGVEVVGSAYDAERGRIPNLTRKVADGEALWFGSHRARVIEVPGHTLGAVAFVIEGAVFSGDTLFGAGCGRLFEGPPEVMVRSLEKLRGLPAETQLYCGHEYTQKNLAFAAQIEPANTAVAERAKRVAALRQTGKPSMPSTIDEERATNPLLRWDAPGVIAKARELGAASADGVEVFAAVRRARDGF